jgi:hypothetical protein
MAAERGPLPRLDNHERAMSRSWRPRRAEAPQADHHPARSEAANRQRLPEPAKIVDAAEPAVRDIIKAIVK